TTTGFQGGSAGPGRKPTRALYTAVASVERVGEISSSRPGAGGSTSHRLFPAEFFSVGHSTLPLKTSVFWALTATEILPCPRTSSAIVSSPYRTLADATCGPTSTSVSPACTTRSPRTRLTSTTLFCSVLTCATSPSVV